MKRSLSALAGAAAATALAASALAVAPTGAASAAAPEAQIAWGLTDAGGLVRFSTADPGTPLRERDITNLRGDEQLVGIDFRPATGQLYGVGDQGGVYSIALPRGRARFVNSLTVPLEGTSFGVDFNPAVDRLRIVSDTGQNLRHDPNAGGTGTIADSPLVVAGSNPAVPVTGIVAAAYTNNDASTATGTILFDLSSSADTLVTQTPANSGAITTIGATGADVTTETGFDVYSTIDGGRTVRNDGYVVTDTTLYTINLDTGQVTSVGAVGGSSPVVDLAVVPAAVLPPV